MRCRAYSAALAIAYRPMPLHRAATRIRSGFRPAKTCRKPLPATPISASSPTATSSRKTVNWRSGETIEVWIGLRVRPGAPGRHHEQRERLPWDAVVARHQQQRVAFVRGRDVVLAAGDDPARAGPAGGGADVVAVGPGVRLGQRERHPPGAVGQTRQPAGLHLVRGVRGQDRAADGGRDDRDEQRQPVRREFLGDDGQLGQPGPAAPVLVRAGAHRAARPGPGRPTARRCARPPGPARRSSRARSGPRSPRCSAGSGGGRWCR